MTRHFHKWSRKEGLDASMLAEAIRHVEQQLSSADLGGGLFKVRVARKGQGKSGGFRTLLIYRAKDRAIFVYGFKKSEKANLSQLELASWREFANTLLAFEEEHLLKALSVGELVKLEEDKDA